MAKKLDCFELELAATVADEAPAASAVDAGAEADDSDMIVIEEDLFDHPSVGRRGIFAVRPGDYRQLFARLRRGGG